ncbi:MAG: hypothetical protein ACR2NN_12825 [Bryobacteraceae bacterium]
MDKTIRRYSSLDDMKRDEYRDWQKLTASERLDAAAELSIGAYRLKDPQNVPERLQRTLVRLQQPEN